MLCENMATEAIELLKKEGDISVRHANGNLRIPGFKLLEGGDTTVDMDKDPECFMMLDPVLVVGHDVVPNGDMRSSARRLRSIFHVITLFFQSRLPNGEEMLRNNGIEYLPDEIFEEIQASLANSDPHFLKFSPTAIKRCLLIFTEAVLDHAPRALPTGKGKTVVRDLAREA